jgi:chemotaxis methyl-accepting protein methylase
MDDPQFQRLLEHFGLSRQGYRKVRKGVKKRLTRHMLEHGCGKTADYITLLERNEKVAEQSRRLLSVSVSRFFRDRKLWEVLETEILPTMIKSCGETLRIWSAGCACGEEAYSLGILRERMRGLGTDLPGFDIIATDLNPLYLEKARRAIYPASSLKEVEADLRRAWFVPRSNGRRFEVASELREGIAWAVHDFLQGPPGEEFHIILVRNSLLTYYPAKRCRHAVDRILGAVVKGGFLVTGSHETVPVQPHDLLRKASLPYVYRKVG